MSRELFGTDGIRGVAGEWPLDEEGVEQIGRAIGEHFTEVGESVVLGYDTRESSPALAAALTRGLTAVGTSVEAVGVVPTPGLAYVTAHSQARAGVMITASHNPWPDNGIKVFSETGNKLPDETESALNSLIMQHLPDHHTRGEVVTSEQRINDYRRFLAGENRIGGDDVYALDMANGATSRIAGQTFRMLGIDVEELSNKPDGRNINEKCGATSTEQLQDFVYNAHLSGGFAFDGDGDRLIAVDENGEVLSGDHILYILAKHYGHDQVVATQMTNMGLEKAFQESGIALHRTAVGDRYVIEGMQQTGARLGGEQSGHIIVADRLWTGDGMLAAIELARAVRESGKSLAEWRSELQLFPQALVNIDTDRKDMVADPSVQGIIEKHMEQLGKNGRVNVRASGTQNQIRVMVESSDADGRAEAIAASIRNLIFV